MTIGLRSKSSLEVSWHVSTRLFSEQQVEPGLSTEEWQELLSIRRELRPVWQLGSRSDKLVYARPQASESDIQNRFRALSQMAKLFSHDSADRFALTPLGEFLTRNTAGSLHSVALLFGVDLAARCTAR